jgi:hypothetical protein
MRAGTAGTDAPHGVRTQVLMPKSVPLAMIAVGMFRLADSAVSTLPIARSAGLPRKEADLRRRTHLAQELASTERLTGRMQVQQLMFGDPGAGA